MKPKETALYERISVRIPRGSDLKQRIAGAVELTGIPETVLVLLSVEAVVDHIEESGGIHLPLSVQGQRTTKPALRPASK